MRQQTIVFYAPLGKNTPPEKIGGAEAGCLKTLEILKKGGHRIILLEKPVNHSLLKYGFELIKTWGILIGLLIKNKKAILHIAGFYLNLVGYEWLLVKTALILQHRCVYEIRNGGMIEEYYLRSRIYKYLMLDILKNVTDILCQGFDYLSFIKEKTGKNSHYYPNYIMDQYIFPNRTKRELHSLQLIFFGRITPAKNIDLIIDICSELQKKGLPFSLRLIGGYGKEYHLQLLSKIELLGIPSKCVIFEGRQNFSTITQRLKDSHFFIFPSREKREGHSNSLTEAMGCGVVPIVSRVGFNASIVGDENLVINAYDASLYANRISEIWQNGQWKNYSNQVYKRITNHFTESIVSKELLNMYDSI